MTWKDILASWASAGTALLPCFAMAACGHDPSPTAQAPHETVAYTKTTATQVPTTRADDKPRGVVLSADILTACHIDADAPSREQGPKAKFDFDRSELRSEDRDVLAKVAACVTTGALKGRELRLTGRTDPRGEEEYNMDLGANRAASVAGYLGALGVPSTQLEQTSRGEIDASGTDEDGWQRDRRVDVDLAPQGAK